MLSSKASGASELSRKQSECVEAACQPPTELVVFQWMMDESKFRLMYRALLGTSKPTAGEVSVLAVHGRLVWAFAATVHEEEIVFRPVGIGANTAAGMWGALEWLLRPMPSLWQALRSLVIELYPVKNTVDGL